MNLSDLGWDDFFERSFTIYSDKSLAAARVVREHRERYTLIGEDGEVSARVSGKMIHTADCRADFPAVGDWVCYSGSPDQGEAVIHAILPRKSKFSRKVPLARTEEQVVAANVDTVFIVSALDRDLNPRRIERYVTLAWESGAGPVILLNKADLCRDIEAWLSAIDAVAQTLPVLVVSALKGEGLDGVRSLVERGKTAAFLGSSGVGKSSLINRLLGEALLDVGEVRRGDGKGRHITTTRQLVVLPSGGMIIDTPGMREIQLWGDQGSLGGSFEDIEDLARRCRFRDCRHRSEPGCAVKEAIADGSLDEGRLTSYVKLQRELESLALRRDQRARLHEKSKWKKIAKWSRQLSKHDPKRRAP
jgi:ribosome biogenesis GTPase